MMVRRKQRGFTLIELLLVLVILVVLAALAVPKFAGRTEQARITAATSDIAVFESALSAYEIDVGRYPTTDEGLDALINQPANAKNWKGPYLQRAVQNDPWGNKYIYVSPGTHSKSGYDLYSTGPDGQEGNDDIDNWTVR